MTMLDAIRSLRAYADGYAGNIRGMCATAADMLEELDKRVPRWISVEEQPEPPEDDVYYCYGYWIGSGRKQAETAEYLCGEWKIVNNFVLTHWMPLPEPPKEGAC